MFPVLDRVTNFSVWSVQIWPVGLMIETQHTSAWIKVAFDHAAADLGGELRSVREDRPGKFGKCPLSKAVIRADKAGDNKEAWAKATNSLEAAEPTGALAVAVGVTGISMCHKLVAITSLCRMATSVEVKVTMQPASHS